MFTLAPRHALRLVVLAGLAAASANAEFVEINGKPYTLSVSRSDAGEQMLYTDATGTYTIEQLRAKVAAEEPQIISAALASTLNRAADDALVDVVVLLRHQPAAPISREVRAALKPQKEAITAQIREITRRALPNQTMTPEQERAWVPVQIDAADQDARRKLAEQLDELEAQARRDIFQRAAQAVAPDHVALADFVRNLGGELIMKTEAVSAMGFRLLARDVPVLAAHPLVATIDLDHPGAPELDIQQTSLGLNTTFWTNNITGGVHDVGVLDTGVQQSHPNLSPHPFLSNMGANDTDTHGTAVAGIMASTHPSFRGMAFGCDKIVVALAGNITTSMPGMNYIVSTGEPEDVNYSFGNGTANTTDYSTTDQFFDGVISTFGFMVSKSTGNGGFGSSTPTITQPAPAYNLLASANMDDFNNTNRNSHRITSSSSRGPTLGGRKKPDITSPGTNTTTTTPSGGFTTTFGGTSSASPHTGGVFVLLWDMGANDTKAGKAILLNTTDAINDNGTSSTADDTWVNGSFWNRRYGWGYMNPAQAYLHGLDFFIDSVPPSPETADYKLYAGQMFTHEKATLVWERHVAYNGVTFPTQIEGLSNLDLFAFRESDNVPVASSQSTIDNVEQLSLTSDEFVVLKVEATGAFDPDITSEEFALATQENFTARTGPAFAGTITAPPTIAPGATFTLTLNLQNSGDLRAHATLATLSGIQVNGNPIQNAGSIGAGLTNAISWSVQAPVVAGPVAVNFAINSDSYGESFSASLPFTLMIGGCPGDANGDMIVNFADLNIILSQYGQTGVGLQGDVNGDGVVNFADLNIVLSNFGLVC
ncbi:MAG: S8 family serine peptidase [Phycisphaerales bacterium]